MTDAPLEHGADDEKQSQAEAKHWIIPATVQRAAEQPETACDVPYQVFWLKIFNHARHDQL